MTLPAETGKSGSGGAGRGMRCMAVASGKGGVGKTFFTVNLAVALNRLGLRVLVIDCDFGLANADILLGLSPERTLQDAVFQGVALGEVIVPSAYGVDLLPAGSGARELLGFGEARLQVLVEELIGCACGYDLVLFDCAAGISGSVMSILASVPRMLLIATPEPTSLVDAYALLKVVYQEGLARKIDLVMNQVGSTEEAGQALNRLTWVVQANFPMELNYLGSIPFSSDARAAILRGCPLCAGNPDSEVWRRVCHIADVLVSQNPKASRLQDANLQGLLKAMLAPNGP